MIGAYAPLAQRVRSYDCFSEFFNWTTEAVLWHIAFYGWWSYDDVMSWVFVAINFLLQGWGGFRTFDVCFDQL